MEAAASFNVTLAPGAEAEGFDDAFYRFLELHSRNLREFEERCGMLQTTPFGDREEKRVSLWSRTAVEQFVRYWRTRRAARPARPRPVCTAIGSAMAQ